jgi:hypothetical protein
MLGNELSVSILSIEDLYHIINDPIDTVNQAPSPSHPCRCLCRNLRVVIVFNSSTMVLHRVDITLIEASGTGTELAERSAYVGAQKRPKMIYYLKHKFSITA